MGVVLQSVIEIEAIYIHYNSLFIHDIQKISPRKGGLGPFGNMPNRGDSAAKIQKF